MADRFCMSASDLDEPSWEFVHAAVQRLEQAWRDTRDPALVEFLPPPDHSLWLVTLVELIKVDQEHRWRHGEYKMGDDYLGEWPELHERPQVREALIEAERRTRAALGVSVSCEEDDAKRPRARHSPVEPDVTSPRANPGPSVCWQPDQEPAPSYRLVRPLGRGGMGEVWEARGPGGMPVALKRVNLYERCGEGELQALELLKKIRHPHLLAIHGFWILDGELVIGLELADESLGALLSRQTQDRQRGLRMRDVTRYLADAAEALDYLGRPIHRTNGHAMRIQHRDVKPANLLLQGGAVKVADFGLAKALEHVVESHSVSMTLAYAPPEFFRGQTAATSDQYSLGITYCELRTGRRPYEGTAHEILDGHLHRQPNLDGLSEAERRVVLRALAKNPEQRWAGCVKFIGELIRATEPGDLGGIADTPQDEPDAMHRTATYRGRDVTTGLLLVGEELVPLPLTGTEVRVAITAATADSRVTQVFVNTHDRAVEATYVFPLPDDAAVHRLRIQIDERIIEGVVREREEARQTYDEAKQEGHGAALVEQTTPNIFMSSVANILPGQEIRVEIAYLQSLPFQDGQYRFVFPMVVSPRYVLGTSEAAEPIVHDVPASIAAPRLPHRMQRGDRVSIEVDLDAGVPLCGFDSPSHDIVVLEEAGTSRAKIALRRDDEIPNRDFVLNYRVAGPKIEPFLFYEPGNDQQAGTFLLLATPPAAEFVAAASREVIFVLDGSRSMSGEPFAQAKQAARQILDRLMPDDAFNVIAFDNEVRPLAAMPLIAEEANLRRARAFLEKLHVRSGTEMLEPLRWALQQPLVDGAKRMRTVVFLTDGSVHGERELLAALRPVIGRTRIVGLGVGTSVNRHLLHRLAGTSRGFAEFIFPGENIAHVVDRTLRRLSYAVLTDVRLEWDAGAVEAILPEPCPDLYRDQPLMLIGRYRGSAPPAVTIGGDLAGTAYETTLATVDLRRHDGGVPLAALWARQRIQDLMDRIWEHPELTAELRSEVIQLAVQHRLASEYTSFLAVDYRSAAERDKAEGAAKVDIPQYMPQGMPSLLDQVIAATPPGDVDRARDLVKSLTAELLGGTHFSQDADTLSREPLQKRLSRVRRPRSYITYDSEVGGAAVARELPCVIGVLGDFSGDPMRSLPPLQNRMFIEVDRDNFDQVVAQLAPRLNLHVQNTLDKTGGELAVQLRFGSMDDFQPASIVKQIEPLRRLLDVRKTADAASIDEALSRQLAAIMHHPRFQQLEATWRGLRYLVVNSETGAALKIQLLDVAKKQLLEDFQQVADVRNSLLFRLVFENALGMIGGEPFAVLLGDYAFSHHSDDVELLVSIARVAAVTHCPFIGGASPEIFGVESLRDISEIVGSGHLAHLFDRPEYTAWRAMRDREESRFLALTLPRTLARMPYSGKMTPSEGFAFEELDPHQPPGVHETFCWMNTAYVWGVQLASCWAKTGWVTAICGTERGGRVEDLIAYVGTTTNGHIDPVGPTEISIADRHEIEFGDLGFLTLCHGKGSDFAAFPSGRTLHKPSIHDGTEGFADEALRAQLPCVLACARFVHCLLAIAHHPRWSGEEASDLEFALERWISNYVVTIPEPTPEVRARCLLRAARVQVSVIPGERRKYRLTAWLQPFLDVQKLSATVQAEAETHWTP